MAHFAKINAENQVTEVIVAEQAFIDSGAVGDPAQWIQTSYNTKAGVNQRGSTALRKNFAGIGYHYDSVRDAFYAPQPYASWQLDDTTCTWQPPTPMPEDNQLYEWNEATQAWDTVA